LTPCGPGEPSHGSAGNELIIMKTVSGLRFTKLGMGVLVLASLCGCAHTPAHSQHMTEDCDALARKVADEQNSFVTRVKAIREQHILMREYDRQMIDALAVHRTALKSTILTDSSAEEGVGGCAGPRLEQMRREALQEMVRLQGFLDTFRRGLQDDPAETFIDAH
jgi:hypothetical protein